MADYIVKLINCNDDGNREATRWCCNYIALNDLSVNDFCSIGNENALGEINNIVFYFRDKNMATQFKLMGF
jgi:hypothetical protein